MSLFQFILMALTCSGSLCMNLDRAGAARWKKWGVLLGLAAAPLWLVSEYRDGAQGGMLVSSTWIWGTYMLGAWRLRFELLTIFGYPPLSPWAIQLPGSPGENRK